jgi:desulfoferrodoxin (superoxide reductase-like protein)
LGPRIIITKKKQDLKHAWIVVHSLLAADSRHWPFQVEGQLPNADIAAIVGVVSRAKEIDHHIVWMEAKSPKEVWVFTGRITGTQQGGGDVLTVCKRAKRWTIDDSLRSSWVL